MCFLLHVIEENAANLFRILCGLLFGAVFVLFGLVFVLTHHDLAAVFVLFGVGFVFVLFGLVFLLIAHGSYVCVSHLSVVNPSLVEAW